jgi:hypothetical protein
MYLSNANETPTVAADRIRTSSLLAPSDCSNYLAPPASGSHRPEKKRKGWRSLDMV